MNKKKSKWFKYQKYFMVNTGLPVDINRATSHQGVLREAACFSHCSFLFISMQAGIQNNSQILLLPL